MGRDRQEVGVLNSVKLSFGAEFECVWISEGKEEDEDIDGLSYLLKIQQIFSDKNLHLNVQHDPKGEVDYNVWNITYDGSINANSLNVKELPSRCAIGSWTASSAELISPPLPAPDTKSTPISFSSQPSLATIKQYIQTIRGTATTAHGSFVNSECGFHIHFGIEPGSGGVQPNSSIPLPVLQELAFLLVRFEEIISTLHSPIRRGLPLTTSGRYCRSNLTSFLWDGHTCVGQPLIPLDEIRGRIFAPDVTVEKLAWIMGAEEPLDSKLQPKNLCKSQQSNHSTSSESEDKSRDSSLNQFAPSKYKMVNWSLLCAKNRPQTIEFRQPDGTLNEHDIAHVIWFYTALIRTAEWLSNQSQAPWTEAHTPTLANLLDLLEIHEPTMRKYWLDRQQQYAVSEFEPDLMKWQKCHLCARKQDLRHRLRERRQVVSRGGWSKGKRTKGMTRKEKRNAKTEQRVRNRAHSTDWMKRDAERPCADAGEPARPGFW